MSGVPRLSDLIRDQIPDNAHGDAMGEADGFDDYHRWVNRARGMELQCESLLAENERLKDALGERRADASESLELEYSLGMGEGVAEDLRLWWLALGGANVSQVGRAKLQEWSQRTASLEAAMAYYRSMVRTVVMQLEHEQRRRFKLQDACARHDQELSQAHHDVKAWKAKWAAAEARARRPQDEVAP